MGIRISRNEANKSKSSKPSKEKVCRSRVYEERVRDRGPLRKSTSFKSKSGDIREQTV